MRAGLDSPLSRAQSTMSQVPSIKLPAFAEHVGIEILELDKERVVGRIRIGPQHSNGGDRVHGGAIMTLADTLGAFGTVMNLPPQTSTTTLESKTNFLAAGRGDYLVGESTPLHVGSTHDGLADDDPGCREPTRRRRYPDAAGAPARARTLDAAQRSISHAHDHDTTSISACVMVVGGFASARFLRNLRPANQPEEVDDGSRAARAAHE